MKIIYSILVLGLVVSLNPKVASASASEPTAVCFQDNSNKTECISTTSGLDNLVHLAYIGQGYDAYDANGEVRMVSCYKGSSTEAAALVKTALSTADLVDVYENTVGASTSGDGSPLLITYTQNQCTAWNDEFAGEPACSNTIVVNRTTSIPACPN